MRNKRLKQVFLPAMVCCMLLTAGASAVFGKPAKSAPDAGAQRHRWSNEYTVDAEPSCEKEGIQSRHCMETGCDERTDETIIPALGHSYQSQVTRQPTCAQEGEKTFACIREDCGDTYTEPIEPFDHRLVGTAAKEPTCTADGNLAYWTCTQCGKLFADRRGENETTRSEVMRNALGHDYLSEMTVKPTCTMPGKKTYTCQRKNCGNVYVETIAALEHSYQDIVTQKASFSQNGSVTVKCEKCGLVKEKKIIASPQYITMERTVFNYTGKNHHTKMTVYDRNKKKIASSNYSISYPKGRKNVGTRTLKVTFKKASAYTGSLSKSFQILPEKTKIESASAAKTTIKAVVQERTEQVSGYEVRYSTDSEFAKSKTKTVKLKGKTNTSVKLSELKSDKKYYLGARTYKKVTENGKAVTYYSGWSTTKSLSTKKK